MPQTFLFDLDGCKSGNKQIPAGDCDVKHGTIRFSFNPNKGQFNFVVSDGEYPLHTIHSSSHSYIFIADLAKGTKLKNFLVQTKEESAIVFVKFLSTRFTTTSHFSQDSVINIWQKAPNRHMPAMATTLSVPKNLLLAEAAALAFVCIAVPPATACKRALMSARSAIIILVEPNFIHPARCYPNGYTDVYGVKHVDRPHCLTYDGGGITMPAAAHGENAHRAFEGNGAKPDSVPSHFKLMKESASLLRRLYGRHGWRPHATGNARLCIVACMRP